MLRLVWPVFRDTIGPAAAQGHTPAHVTLSEARIRDAGMVTMENMTPGPRAFRLSARQQPPELKMPGIGTEVDKGRQLSLCRAVEAGGGRAARLEVPTRRNVVEAG